MDGLLQGVHPLPEGMAPPGLLIALDDGLRRGLQKQHPAHALHGLELIQHAEELRKGVRRAHVVHQGHPLVAAAGPGAELREFQNHGRGHIVHDIKAHILQERSRLALSRTGQAGNNQDLQR